jgi:hypothetical protein
MLTWHEVRRRLWLALLFGGAAATIGVVLQNLDRLRGIAPERVVTIYRIHGCQCAVTWAAALEQRGYVVRIWEYETLEHVRRSLGTPQQLHGCHVASYLNYFLEGHVPAKQLRRLFDQRPTAVGIVVGSSSPQHEHARPSVSEGAQVSIVDRQGRSHEWLEATAR